MSSGDKRDRMVVDQKDALDVYFEALLRVENKEEATEVEHTGKEALQEVAQVVRQPVIAVPVIPEVETETTVETEIPVAEAEKLEVEQVKPELPEGIPEWAAEPFQALLFKVAGLTLAVPLAELSGVQELQDGMITPMLGRIEWYLGLMEYRGRQAPAVDTAQLVLPPDRLNRLMSEDREPLGHVVFIQDGQWGLACDSVDEVITLDYESVKWRSSRTKRRWLAGTVLDHMCAIIDPPAFGEMLRTGMHDMPEVSDEQSEE